MDETKFRDLIARVRMRDADAAAELVQYYEAAVRRSVRFRLTDSSLRRLVDSADIFQSVAASFFCRIALGEYEVDTSVQLMGLLTRMAHNKLLNQARHHHTAMRDVGRNVDLDDVPAVAATPGPSTRAEVKDLIEQVRAKASELPDIHRKVIELSLEGLTLKEIGERIDRDPDHVSRIKKEATIKLNQLLDGEDADGS